MLRKGIKRKNSHPPFFFSNCTWNLHNYSIKISYFPIQAQPHKKAFFSVSSYLGVISYLFIFFLRFSFSFTVSFCCLIDSVVFLLVRLVFFLSLLFQTSSSVFSSNSILHSYNYGPKILGLCHESTQQDLYTCLLFTT